jgi:hypothetical protein
MTSHRVVEDINILWVASFVGEFPRRLQLGMTCVFVLSKIDIFC